MWTELRFQIIWLLEKHEKRKLHSRKSATLNNVIIFRQKVSIFKYSFNFVFNIQNADILKIKVYQFSSKNNIHKLYVPGLIDILLKLSENIYTFKTVERIFGIMFTKFLFHLKYLLWKMKVYNKFSTFKCNLKV